MATKKIIKTADAPQAIGPYSQAVEAGGFVFVSGQIPIDPKTGAWPRRDSYFYVHYDRPFLIPPPAAGGAPSEIRWD